MFVLVVPLDRQKISVVPSKKGILVAVLLPLKTG
jgi:hypothetical protein